MARGRAHPPELRAQVVGAKGSGESIAEVAVRFNVAKSTVERWWATDGPTQPDQRVRTREAMADLIYDTLADMLSAVRVQLQAASSKEWLAQQTAGDVVPEPTETDRLREIVQKAAAARRITPQAVAAFAALHIQDDNGNPISPRRTTGSGSSCCATGASASC
jgi:transposase-like protein